MLKPLRLKVVPLHHDRLVYQHDYGSGGYEKYRQLQVYHNKRIDSVWADSDTLADIASYILDRRGRPKIGLCHGSRNGFEQSELARLLGCDVFGTDISDTAVQIPNTFEWDFHEPRPEWRDKFSFVYSNSLDQAFDPKRALITWSEQLEPESGLLFLEHTMAHSAEGASEMDPFGAHPMAMPYLIFQWGAGRFELIDILRPLQPKSNNGLEAWIFVIGRPRAAGAAPHGG